MRSFLGGVLLGSVVASCVCLFLLGDEARPYDRRMGHAPAERAAAPEGPSVVDPSTIALPLAPRQSIYADDLEQPEITESVDDSFKSDPVWIESQRRLRVVAGLDTRETIGDAAADEAIFEQARRAFTELPGAHLEVWRSELMGFATTDELAAFEDSISTRSSTIQTIFSRLDTAADSALTSYQEALGHAWEAKRYLQVSEPGGTLPSSEEWREEMGVGGWPRSVLQKSHRAQIADRMFRFHFFSYEYPQVELRYSEAKSLAADLRELVAAD